MILPPRRTRSDPNRFSDCQRAIEDELVALLTEATEAGWDKDEVLAAIVDVADNTALALQDNSLLSEETELRRFRRKKPGE
ncbi:hypothetical protein OSJ77_20110 [Phyllobacterium sp. 0TCS1.6C]|jgi:hypothetical protein|uniref:hypothetical protein n=1 Tax=unclassified Phyllobacterium TaxID=2638441 RepID=UPI0022656E69|nr:MULTISPECIES: hypothetical protein [unclassified Phyllobacterium]MCX8282500.1 hypothetical protein [Phyllobacterium sp. 0TCS1.6C]MCX8292592.1 hypothetical protein [Phyllobacterium sp. 0TCS1.6A]